MRKVDIEFVRWNVGALGEVAQIAHVALVDYLVVIGDIYTIDFQGLRLIDEVEKRRERVA